MMKLSVITVTYNSSSFVDALVPRLMADLGQVEETEFTVWDNASNDDTVLRLRELGVRVLESSVNLGFAKACNEAVKQSSGSMLAFVNPDIQIVEGSFLSALEQQGNSAILAPRIVDLAGCEVQNPTRFPNPWEELPGAMFGPLGRMITNCLAKFGTAGLYAEGCCFFVPRSLWTSLGGLDEGFFLYGEEADFCQRAIGIGAIIVPLPGLVVQHMGGDGFRTKSVESSRLLMAGKRRLIQKWYGRRACLIWAATWRVGLLIREGLYRWAYRDFEMADRFRAGRQGLRPFI
jgi:hypothetical protein